MTCHVSFFGMSPQEGTEPSHEQAPTVAAYRSARFWELLVGVLKHAAACRSGLNFSHGGLFFFDNMLNLSTLCYKAMSELDSGLVVKVLDSSLQGLWFNTWYHQIFACQFFSAIPQIFSFSGVSIPCQLLRILPLLRHHRGLRSHRNLQRTRRQPGVQQIVYSGPLGKVLGTTLA